VEYDPAEVDRFIEMADAIEAAFPGVLVDGNEVRQRREDAGALAFFLFSAGVLHLVRIQYDLTFMIVFGCLQVEDRPEAFDIALDDGTLVFTRQPGVEVPSDDYIISTLSNSGLRPA
jgi:hypothetical protein